ncbi:MAG: foldase protein PrsA [Solirubrobacteraceae bacterium]|nr:foldase protein PrsA [Solirubrobacteraceae bacterium]
MRGKWRAFASIVAVVLSRIRLLPALGAFFVLAIAIAACGDSVPGNAVARVDDESITKDQFNHWMGIAQATSQGAAASSRTVYNPPDFTACVAKLKSSTPKPAKGQPKPTDATFKAQCKTQYEQFRDQVLQFLISEKWIRKESKDQGIKFTKADLDKEAAKVFKQSFPKQGDLEKFLKSAGMTLDDARLQVGFNTLSTKLRTKVIKDADPVTNADISKYYAKNKSKFATPEKRDIRVVLTKTKAKAEQARAALDSGQSWKVVTKKYSIDKGSAAKGGVLAGLPKGNQEKTLDDAIFGAQKGKLTGPVKTQFGYYVFAVQKITPAQQQTLKQASATIKQQLATERQRTVITKFSDDLRKKWKAKTNCRKGYVTQDCKNAPKVNTTATAATPQQPTPQPAQP